MRISCGTDIIEIDRIQDGIEKNGDRFLNKIYTDEEIEYCESTKKQKYQHYAGRFAAKEATFKAISSELNDKYSISWKDIEIKNNNQGKPELNLLNVNTEKIVSVDVSISHCNSHAIASVVVLYKD